MHILMTGGTGFFGRAFLRFFATIPHINAPKITVLSRSIKAFKEHYPYFFKLPFLSFHEGDILRPSSLPRDLTFTHILHAAADSTFSKNLTPLQRYTQIVDGTQNLLDLAVSCGAEGFLLTSSGAVYGQQPAALDKIPEDYHGMPDPLDANNAYGIGKRTAEHLCAQYTHAFGIRTVIARCFAFGGPDLPLDVHFAIGNFVRDALWRDTIIVNGDGSQVRSYLDQRDLANWLLVLLSHGKAARAYNVGSDMPIKIDDLAHLVRDIISPNKKVQLLGNTEQLTDRNYYVPDIQRARLELGLNIHFSLDETIRSMKKSGN